MPVETQCEHCGFAYISKEEMLGKKVRCRNCGQIFTVAPSSEAGGGAFSELPPESNDDTGFVPAVTIEESNMTGGVGSAKSRMERAGDPGTFDFNEAAIGEQFRASVPFVFPYSRTLDSSGPKLLTLGLLAWLSYRLFTWSPAEGQANPIWAGLLPVILALLLFVVIWMPIIRMAVRQVGRTMKFKLPGDMGMRTAAVASVPFAFGGLFWLVGESVVTFAVGTMLGAIVSVPVAWFLYRLRQLEIAHAAVAILTGSLLAGAISAGAFYGINYAAGQGVASTPYAEQFDHSPFGPKLDWPPPQVADKPFAPLPFTPNPSPTQPAQTPPITTITPIQPVDPGTANNLPKPGETAPPPPPGNEPAVQVAPRPAPEVPEAPKDPLANHAVLTDGRVIDVPVVGGQIVYPFVGEPAGESGPGPINFFAVVSSSADGDMVAVYQIKPFGLVHPAKPFAATIGSYTISADGDLLARVTRFGGPSIQIWSYSRDRVIGRVPLDREAQFVAFLDKTMILCGWRNQANSLELGAYDVAAQKWIDYVISNDPHGPWVTPLWAGDRFSLLTVGSSVRDNALSLRIYPPLPGARPVFLPIMRRDAAVALGPTAITASPDGTQLAIAFEQEGQLQISIFRRPERTPTAAPQDLKLRDHILPGGLGLPPLERAAFEPLTASSCLTWLATGKPQSAEGENTKVSGVMFYKLLTIDPDQGRVLDRLSMGSPTMQKAIDAQTMHFVFPGAKGPRILEGKLRH